MRMTMVLLSAAMCLNGCINEHIAFQEVTLEGEIEAPKDASGLVHVVLHHGWQGKGLVRHPLGPFESFTLKAPGPFTKRFEHPTDDGEGLVIYAWQDSNGDDALCAPGGEVEHAGLQAFDKLDYRLQVKIVLNQPCKGPERLFP